MISLTHRTIFVHIPKCAGQSVEAAFCEDLGLDWDTHRHLLGCLKRPLSVSDDLPQWLAHLTAAQYAGGAFCPAEMFRDFFTFAVVRDPVDRMVSLWRWVDVPLPFDDWVAERMPKRLAERHPWFLPQCDYVCQPGSDEVMVDKVVSVPDLAAQWPHIAARAGVKAPLAHRNRSNVARPQVSAATVARIREAYAGDVRLLEALAAKARA